jgi:hypothetical protein
MVQYFQNILQHSEIKTLLDYLDVNDDRTDHRPDVRSKHPRWNQDAWPQHVVEKSLVTILGNRYQVEEITFQDTKIGLKPHVDNGSQPGTRGLTVMLCLHADPEAHTVFFKNHCLQWSAAGQFFTRIAWTPFQYHIPNRHGEMIYVEDIREFIAQAESDPGSLGDFDITVDSIAILKETAHKRSLPRLDLDTVSMETGFIQPGPRNNDYNLLSGYDADKKFDPDIHQRYLSHVDINDLHGLTWDQAVPWTPGLGISFDRDQLHASSGCHARKKFVTIFCHQL